jgi:hypothetical protein
MLGYFFLYLGFVRGTLPAHWSANERAPLVPRLSQTSDKYLTPGQIRSLSFLS